VCPVSRDETGQIVIRTDLLLESLAQEFALSRRVLLDSLSLARCLLIFLAKLFGFMLSLRPQSHVRPSSGRSHKSWLAGKACSKLLSQLSPKSAEEKADRKTLTCCLSFSLSSSRSRAASPLCFWTCHKFRCEPAKPSRSSRVFTCARKASSSSR
jgi:hypothetical protein